MTDARRGADTRHTVRTVTPIAINAIAIEKTGLPSRAGTMATSTTPIDEIVRCRIVATAAPDAAVVPRRRHRPAHRSGAHGRSTPQPPRSSSSGPKSGQRTGVKSVLGVGRLPDQEVAGAQLTGGADNQVGVGACRRCRDSAPPSSRRSRLGDSPSARCAARPARAPRGRRS